MYSAMVVVQPALRVWWLLIFALSTISLIPKSCHIVCNIPILVSAWTFSASDTIKVKQSTLSNPIQARGLSVCNKNHNTYRCKRNQHLKQQHTFIKNNVITFSSSHTNEDQRQFEVFDNTSRRTILQKSIFNMIGIVSTSLSSPIASVAVDGATTEPIIVDVVISGEVQRIFNEGRAYELQGNVLAAQRLFEKVVVIAPNYIYGYSNLGNVQTVQGNLIDAEKSYTTAINLCNENLRQAALDPTIRKCTDLYILLLNRGCIRLNTIGQEQLALYDLQQANTLRARPDSVVLQNLARAEEYNGLYDQANTNYNTAISMTANEVTPLWIRSVLVKYQLQQYNDSYDIFQRVQIRFPDAPEVCAVSAILQYTYKHDTTAAQQKFLQIPDRQRLKFSNTTYLTQIIHWPSSAQETILQIASIVGDKKSV